MEELDLTKLEGRVDALIKTIDRLQSENKTLRDSHSNLQAERTRLLEKTDLARTRVEAMIGRLKAIENDG
jgi:cell division protein ZapB